MGSCRYKKIIQFYLDGSVDVGKTWELEEHLKNCPACQLELAELEELNLAALEIIEEAPDPGYWTSFYNRVLNRILARNIGPAQTERKVSWLLSWRTASVLVGLIFLTVSAVVVMNSLHMRASHRGAIAVPSQEPVAEQPMERSQARAQTIPRASIPSSAAGPTNPSAGSDREAAIMEKSTVAQVRVSRDDQLVLLRWKEPLSYFRDLPSSGRPTPGFKFELEAPSMTSTPEYDESYRLRGSFLSQRLLAGIGSHALNGSVGLQGAMSGLRENGGRDIAVTWGYAKVPVDTAKSDEIKRYYIELDLMQAR
jgi:hypothetical protein